MLPGDDGKSPEASFAAHFVFYLATSLVMVSIVVDTILGWFR